MDDMRAYINNKEVILFELILLRRKKKVCILSQKSCEKVWWSVQKFVPLHPQNRKSLLSSKETRSLIDLHRQIVVQEAGALSGGIWVERYEPSMSVPPRCGG